MCFAGVSGRRADEAAAAGSSGAHSSDKSADAVLTADCTIDFTSAAWKAMSRKEKNRASAAASRARREAYTESLEDKVTFSHQAAPVLLLSLVKTPLHR